MKCAGKTKAGKPCQRHARRGEKFCHGHSGDDDVGQHGKLTVATTEKILVAIRAGAYAKVAAAHAGISEATYYRWLQLADDPSADPKYLEFRESLTRAEADAEVHAVAQVRSAMGSDWRAAVAYLERRHSERWRRRMDHEHSGPDGGPVRISEEVFADPATREALDEVVRRVAAERESADAGD